MNSLYNVLLRPVIILVCLGPFTSHAQKKPVKTFEYLWKLFDEKYASFEEKGIDWQASYDTYRGQVSEETTDEELFVVLTQMLRPLHDGHVNLKAKKLDTAFNAERPSRIMRVYDSLETKKGSFGAMYEATLMKIGFDSLKEIGPTFRDMKLFRYTDNGRIGYLRFFRSFSKLAKMVGFSLEAQLDEVFNSFEGLDGLIVDVRFNIGGDDRFSQRVVGRFIEEEMLGFKKQTRKDMVFGELSDRYVKPRGGQPFLKPVVLLTNDQTVSAADVLALMMDQLPNVTIMGEPSNGSYSDLYGRKLPNGWRVTLSNQRYYSVDMVNYEGVGTPVDIEVLNTRKDFVEKNDSVLLEAMEFLEARSEVAGETRKVEG